MQIVNEKLGITLTVKDDITQADLEVWESELPLTEVRAATWRGAMLRGAIKAKIVTEPNVMPTDPLIVKWLGVELGKIYGPFVTVDPKQYEPPR